MDGPASSGVSSNLKPWTPAGAAVPVGERGQDPEYQVPRLNSHAGSCVPRVPASYRTQPSHGLIPPVLIGL